MLQFSSSISRQVWWVFEKEFCRDVVFEVTQLAKQLKAPEMKPAQVQVWPANSSKKIMLLQGLIICNGINSWGWIQHNTWIATVLVKLCPFLHYMPKLLPISLCSVLRNFDAIINMGLQFVSSHRFKSPMLDLTSLYLPRSQKCFSCHLICDVRWSGIPLREPQPTMRSQILDT